jgi:EAL domain-containing protein (putative c-di-GMP-specific phosphodiesterase class I)/ActR/RegA family two-component response regulator
MLSSGTSGRLLIVDDDVLLSRSLSRHLSRAGYDVVVQLEGEPALAALKEGGFDLVISDIEMPGLSGIDLLREVRDLDRDLPVVLITGAPAIDTAAKAVEHGAFRYLTKPFDLEELQKVVRRASQLYRLARMKREALVVLGTGSGEGADRLALEASFERALESLWMAFQPIVRAEDGSLFGYEALLRSSEPAFPHPGAVVDAAERLNELRRLGRVIRERAAEPMSGAEPGTLLLLNLHPDDLLDPVLHADDTSLAALAPRVVLEITERAALDKIPDVPARVRSLRERGFRVAVDDLGAGYAGLASFALLEPDIVKLDMSLVRGVHASQVKQKLVRSMTMLCKDLGLQVVAEGVELREERDQLVELGCDLLQGYLFAKPGRPFPAVTFGG